MVKAEDEEARTEERPTRKGVVWQCVTRDLRQRHKTEGCGFWNMTHMRKIDGHQVPCGYKLCQGRNKAPRRTRITPPICTIFDDVDEAYRYKVALNKRDNFWGDEA